MDMSNEESRENRSALTETFEDLQEFSDPCSYEPIMPEARFYFVAIFGTLVASISTLENSVLFCVLLCKRTLRASHLFYLTFLAFFDIIISLSYIPLMSIPVVADYPHFNPPLYEMWVSYVRPVLALSHVAMSSSTYILIAATLERFMISRHLHKFVFDQKRRVYAVILAIIAGFFFKGTVFIELTTEEDFNCTSQARYRVDLSDLAKNYWYKTVWMFYIRHISQVFIPFFGLLFMNILIVHSLRKKRRMELHRASSLAYSQSSLVGSQRGFDAKEAKRKIRVATRMFVLVTTVYLLANVLNLVVVVWEHVDKSSLLIYNIEFYSFAADGISILTVLCGALRPLIYISCNKAIRKEICGLISSCSCCWRSGDTLSTKQYSCHTMMTMEELSCLLTPLPSARTYYGSSNNVIQPEVWRFPTNSPCSIHCHAVLNGNVEVCIIDDTDETGATYVSRV